MTSFYVDHGAHEEITSVLFASHRDMGTILEGLNARLNSMPEAVKGQAVPLWAEHQTKWNADYGTMHANLGSGANAAANIGDIFVEGDRNGARVMM